MRAGGPSLGVRAARAMAAILSAKFTWLSSSGLYPIFRRALAMLQKRWVFPLMPYTIRKGTPWRSAMCSGSRTATA